LRFVDISQRAIFDNCFLGQADPVEHRIIREPVNEITGGEINTIMATENIIQPLRCGRWSNFRPRITMFNVCQFRYLYYQFSRLKEHDIYTKMNLRGTAHQLAFRVEKGIHQGIVSQKRKTEYRVSTFEKMCKMFKYVWLLHIYMTIPSPYLKVEKSDMLTDPEAVKVTLGAISRINEAETRPDPTYLALTVPKEAL
jgi:hypothetical protein